ncbi:hypothetical protein [Mechercharimyces sp. CAU 1602]|uniref:hypothetical protein n=1 Tax=Mechercharimyces sp. CAU 1602 TaxID=2973933 RepID=UPI0021624733|nr:hypothetical protein [Mechercharimyces sp. CAU 1602]MCS1350387.1 hypothetical protein [Mechercharimyces sp. CAU 1602]
MYRVTHILLTTISFSLLTTCFVAELTPSKSIQISALHTVASSENPNGSEDPGPF